MIIIPINGYEAKGLVEWSTSNPFNWNDQPEQPQNIRSIHISFKMLQRKSLPIMYLQRQENGRSISKNWEAGLIIRTETMPQYKKL